MLQDGLLSLRTADFGATNPEHTVFQNIKQMCITITISVLNYQFI